MTNLPMGEFRPSLNDLNSKFTSSVVNVLPQADGYGPFPEFDPMLEKLPGEFRGGFTATNNSDGQRTIFAATSTNLYRLGATGGWISVSKNNTAYTSLGINNKWYFVQLGNTVVATHERVPMQSYVLGSSSAFADLSTDAPRAAYISIVEQAIMASGIPTNRNRIQWSDFNDPTAWAIETGSNAGMRDLPDGGPVNGPVTGGEFAFIFQEEAIRRISITSGPEIFIIERLIFGTGVQFPETLVELNEGIFFLSTKGFAYLSRTGELNFAGREAVDRHFFRDYDPGQPTYLISGLKLTRTNQVLISYRSRGGQEFFDRILVFDTDINRWSQLRISGQFMFSLSRPVDSLETLAQGGADIITAVSSDLNFPVTFTIASTAGYTTGEYRTISGVVGATEINGTHEITVVDSVTIRLSNVTHTNAYISGGIIEKSLNELDFSLDDLPINNEFEISIINISNQLTFSTRRNLEAEFSSSEIGNFDTRMKIGGTFINSDAQNISVRIDARERLGVSPEPTETATPNRRGFCRIFRACRFARFVATIASNTEWTYFSGFNYEAGKRGR